MICTIKHNRFAIDSKECKFCNEQFNAYDMHVCYSNKIELTIGDFLQRFTLVVYNNNDGYFFHDSKVFHIKPNSIISIIDNEKTNKIEINSVEIINSASTLEELYTNINLLLLFS
jgi:hypothetical protein